MPNPGDLRDIAVFTRARMAREGVTIQGPFLIEVHRQGVECERRVATSYAQLARFVATIPHERIVFFRTRDESGAEFALLLGASRLAEEVL